MKPKKVTSSIHSWIDYGKDLFIRITSSLVTWLLLIATIVCVAYALRTIGKFLSYWFNLNLY